MITKISIFLASLILFLIPLNSFPLRNWDEAWYGEIIKNMASGDYSLFVPFWNGQYYFDKPPLYFWLTLPVVHLFGLGEWQIRFVSVIASAFSVLLVYLISTKLFNKVSGLLSVLVFLSLGQVYVRFSHGNLDALLICLFLATYYFWLKGRKFVLLCGITLGLGFLVKGWTLGLFPLFVIGTHSWVMDRRFVPKGILYIVGLSLLVSGWWYVLGTIYFGREFFNWYVLTLAEGNFKSVSFSLQPILYLIRDVGIWWGVVGFVVVKLFSNNKNIFLLFLVTCFFLLFLCFTYETPDWHNLPVYPFIAIIVGWLVYNLYKKFGKIILVTCYLLLVTQVFISYKIENIYPDRSRIGAELGYSMTVIKQPGDTVILDDHDFTSFLYYSNMGKVYVVSADGGKPGEFWTLKYSDLPDFIKTHKQVVLISRDIEKIYPINGHNSASGLGYDFIRF